MKQKRTVIGVTLMLAVLMLGIGYAVIGNIPLDIKGKALAKPSDDNFIVKFTGTPSVSDETKAEAAIEQDAEETYRHATINVHDLTANGETVTATYTIINESPDLNAALTATTTNSNTDYFEVSYEIAEPALKSLNDAPLNETTIVVTVKLIKTLIDEESVEAEIGVDIQAAPTQPTA